MENKKNFYIDGKWVTPKVKRNKVINPATEENCAVITLGNKDDVNDAVMAAKKAYSSWAFSTKEERINYWKNFTKIIKKDGPILQVQLLLRWEHQKILQQTSSWNRCCPFKILYKIFKKF